jgi:hypothetical protein
MRTAKDIAIIVWAYLGEVILGSLAYGLIIKLWDYNKLTDFILKASDDFASKFTAIMFAGSIAFFWGFFSHSNTEFAKWLYKKNAFNIYLKAFLYAIAIFLLTTLALVITQVTQNRLVSAISGWLFVLAIINMFTFIWNIVGIMKLNIVFNIRLEKEKQKKE